MSIIDFILLTIGYTLVYLSGVAKAGQDSLAHHYKDTTFWAKNNDKYWDITVSGNNKWKDGKKENGEKFWQSSRLLVFLTEGWHLFDMIRTKGSYIGLALVLYTVRHDSIFVYFFAVVAMILVAGFSFVLYYNKFFKLRLYSPGDRIIWYIANNYPESGRHEAEIQNIDMQRRCYGVYADYGMDYIPFTECKRIKNKS